MLFELEVGGWVKLVKGQTVINGFIYGLKGNLIKIEGLPPLNLQDWRVLIIKPAPGRTTSIRKTNYGSNG